MKFGQLILRRIVKIVATECQILRLKCTKIDFGCGSALDPAGGSLQRSPRPPAGSKERGYRKGQGGEEGGEGRGGVKGRG